jgi:hypothetical protein
MKQDARKNSHRRKRQKRRLALKKYRAEKKSKGVAGRQLMLISTFQEFPTHLSPFFQSLGFKHLEQSEAVERLERLELAAASMSAATLIVNRGCKRLR